MSNERAKPNPHLPKPTKPPKAGVVTNPSTPGVQTPNRPGGRDAPPAGETRG
jgi:hypothetical protein